MPMTRRSFLAAVALFSLVVLTTSSAAQRLLSLPLENTCALIGFNSGCSGCIYGTKNLCHYVMATDAAYPSGGVAYSCQPKAVALARIDAGLAKDASHVCAANPNMETIIADPLVAGNITQAVKKRSVEQTSGSNGSASQGSASTDSPNCTQNGSAGSVASGSASQGATCNPAAVKYSIINLPTLSTYNSTTVSTAFAKASRHITIDRTSLYGVVGEVQLSGLGQYLPDVSCATLNSAVLLDLNKIFVGRIRNQRDRFCARSIMSMYLTTRCPAYGVAVSGICQSFADQIAANCGSGRSNIASAVAAVLFPGETTPSTMAVDSFLYQVVPDGTVHCLSAFPLVPNEAFDHFAGLDKSDEELQDPDTAVIFGV